MSSDRPRDMLRGRRRRRRRRKKQSRRRGMRGLCAASARVEGEARRAGERVVLEGWQRWQRCGEAGRGRRRGEVVGGGVTGAPPNPRAFHAHLFFSERSAAPKTLAPRRVRVGLWPRPKSAPTQEQPRVGLKKLP